MRHFICMFFIVGILISCKKSKDEEPDKEPGIELVSVTPLQVEQFTDTVTVVLKYKDSNGDLGFKSPDEYALEVKDSRLNKPDLYHIPPLSPPDSKISIEGQIEVNLKPLFLLGNSTQETVTFTIKMKDQEGNWSNQVITPVITIHDSL